MLNIKPSEEYVKLARRCDLLPSDRAIRKVWGCARNPQLSWIREEMTAKGWAFEYPPTGWIKVTARPPAEEQEPWQEKKSGY
ncbi:MAG: hypothetical protein GY832_44570, partial [Chloroflexi bacterium]|nr:hypothetical protein [Chloroflexota bacterium]